MAFAIAMPLAFSYLLKSPLLSRSDFLDLDKDGNTSEPMKQAAKQAKKK